MDGLHVAFTGRIGTEPERRFTPQGSETIQFSLLPHDTKADPEQPEWVRVSAFVERLAEDAVPKLAKGAEVYVEGRLRLGRWTGQDGAPRAGLNVNAWTVQPMGQIGRRAPRDSRPVARGRSLDPLQAGG